MSAPRTATRARWLQDAPKGLAAVYDSGPNRGADRYTALYSGPVYCGRYGELVTAARFMSESPYAPHGIGIYGDAPFDYAARRRMGKKIRFLDLPPDCQNLVCRDCAEQTFESRIGGARRKSKRRPM